MNGSSDRYTATSGRRQRSAALSGAQMTAHKRGEPDRRDGSSLHEASEGQAELAERVRVVVISLADSPRRERITRQLATAQMQWSFFDALRNLQVGQPGYEESRALRYWGRPLTPSEIGCAASHIAVLEAVSQRSEGEWTVVMEDDVFLDPAFDVARAAKFCKLAGIGYLRFYAKHLASPVHVAWLGRRELVRFKRAPMGTQAYLVSPKAARQFLRSLRFVDRPIDWEMDRFWANGLLNYAICPFPCIELNVGSSVSKRPSGASPGVADRLVWVAWKLYQRTLRTLHNLCLRRNDASIRRSYASHGRELKF